MTPLFVIVVQFGEHSTNKIAQILDQLRVQYQVVLPNEIPTTNPTHIILSGGPKHVYESDHYPLPMWIDTVSAPVLGICYGMQIIAHTFGGLVRRMSEQQKGRFKVTELIDGKQLTRYQWMNRFDRVVTVPRQFNITGMSEDNHISAFTDNRRWWAVQYHPESSKCTDRKLFVRFLSRGIPS